MRTIILAAVALGTAAAALYWQAPPKAQQLLEDYRERLTRTLEIDITEPNISPQRWLTDQNLRFTAEPETRTSLGKALSLGECGLVPELARANNSLGKVAPSSDRLLQTQRMLSLATECQPQTDALQIELDRLIAHRQALWPVTLSNMLLAGPEWSAHFKASTAPLPPGVALDSSLEALLDWVSVQSAAQPKDPERLTPLLKNLLESNQGAATLRAGYLALDYLPELTQALDATTICQGPRSPEQRKLAQQVFASQYLERVQPWLSDVEKSLRVIDRVNSVLSNQGAPTPRWLAANFDLKAYQSLVKQHALAWRDLLLRCGVSPGNR